MSTDDHHSRHVHLDEAAWGASTTYTELEGEVLLPFVTRAAAWVAELRRPAAPPVRRIFDIGSGPGVGTCELARCFPEAEVVAVDGSPAMLERTTERVMAQGLDGRVRTRVAELPGGLDGIGRADVIWASMSLHHVADEVAALRLLGDLLGADGLLAIAERADPMRLLPHDLHLGRPGLVDRLDGAGASWFARMRAGLTDPVASTDLPSMLAAAGFEVVGDRLVTERLDPPLADDARRLALGHLRRMSQEMHDHLDHNDRATLEVLTDPDDPRGVLHRPDVFVAASRRIVVARPTGDRRRHDR